jgi:ureidoglycolate dehydrogenase (NAD+)
VSAQQENVSVVVPEELHNRLVAQVYQARGYEAQESQIAAEYAGLASRHGIKTHAALKALHLEHLFGSRRGLAKGGANIQVIDTGFDAVVKINAHYKLGQPVARFAMATCMALADKHGVGVAAVDQPFHYLWGGGYVMEAALQGYIAYTNCTATLAEVVPFLGQYPTIGTNPHSWAFPTQEVVGFPVLVDWATSAVAMGRVQQLQREGKALPPEVAIDKDGQFTQEPDRVFALMPFGGKMAGHKGYGLGLINELYAAYTGGFLPTLRGQSGGKGQKASSCYYFQAMRPEALGAGSFADGKARQANVKAVIDDILGHGNDRAILPGQLEHEAAELSRKHGGLLFSENEIKEFAAVFQEAGVKGFAPDSFRRVKM